MVDLAQQRGFGLGVLPRLFVQPGVLHRHTQLPRYSRVERQLLFAKGIELAALDIEHRHNPVTHLDRDKQF